MDGVVEFPFAETLVFRFLTACAVGMLVGIERGWREREAPVGSRTAGIRTYTIAALLGAVSSALTKSLSSPWPLCIALLCFVSVFAWFKMREIEHDQVFSVTGVLAAFAVFLLGSLAVLGDPQTAAAGGVATAGVLAAREQLHGLLARLTWKELRSALLLLAMTIIVLPALPDRTIDPWMSIKPREIWLLMILTASVSYGGYVAVRLTGPSLGVVVGGLVGSIVSSTAVTIAFARRTSEGGSARMFAGGALIGGMVSILRVLVITALVATDITRNIALPALAAAAAFGIGGFAMIYGARENESSTVAVGNPFDIGPLLLFAAAYSAIALANGWLTPHVGNSSMLLMSGISALFDVDVAVLSAARQASAAADAASNAILVALAANAISRAAVAVVAGRFTFSALYLSVTAVALLCGLAAWWSVVA